MSYTARIKILAEVAENSAFINSQQHACEATGTVAGENEVNRVVNYETGANAKAVSLSGYSAISAVVIEPLGAATPGLESPANSYTTITYQVASTTTGTAFRLYDTDFPVVLVDVDPSADMVFTSFGQQRAVAVTIIGSWTRGGV